MLFLMPSSLDYSTSFTLILQLDPQDWIKKEKGSLKFLACANSNGREEMSLVSILKSKVQRGFNGKTGNELSFNYFFNSKS